MMDKVDDYGRCRRDAPEINEGHVHSRRCASVSPVSMEVLYCLMGYKYYREKAKLIVHIKCLKPNALCIMRRPGLAGKALCNSEGITGDLYNKWISQVSTIK